MKKRTKFYIGLLAFGFFSIFAVFQWGRPAVMEWQKGEAIELLEFQEYTNIEYVSSDGWTNKMEFNVTNKDGKDMTIHVTVSKGGGMTVGP